MKTEKRWLVDGKLPKQTKKPKKNGWKYPNPEIVTQLLSEIAKRSFSLN